jgi:diaminohydroxyphosphoribosylaminopyrimidine deaminase/5-amino-6-(5-phosphoribosylamino)uracil reductase
MQPLRVVVDSRLDAPLSARVLQPPGAVLVYAAVPAEERRRALEGIGCRGRAAAVAAGKVDLGAMLADLALRGINELHVEAGHKLNGSLVREGLVDDTWSTSPRSCSASAASLRLFGPLADLAAAPTLAFRSITPIGRDLRIVARPVPTAAVEPPA